jgi:hypothetical protein
MERAIPVLAFLARALTGSSVLATLGPVAALADPGYPHRGREGHRMPFSTGPAFLVMVCYVLATVIRRRRSGRAAPEDGE